MRLTCAIESVKQPPSRSSSGGDADDDQGAEATHTGSKSEGRRRKMKER